MKSLDSELQSFLKTAVEKDKNYFNALLAVSEGLDGYKWFGATGIANYENLISAVPDSPFFIASITKLFTATVIMQLVEQNKISLDDLIIGYLPLDLVKGINVYKEIDYTDNITIQHLLSHTSGIADYFLEKPKNQSSFFEIILNNTEKEYTVDQTIAFAREKLEANFKPGKKAKYSDTNYQLLGKIIESIEKKELHQVYQEKLFIPLGLYNTWLNTRSEPIEKSGKVVAEFYYNNKIVSNHKPFESSWADGGLISTTKDCIKFLQALLTGKIIDKEKTLPLMHQWKNIGFPLKYGFGTMFIDMPRYLTLFRKVPSLIGHLGSTGSFLLYTADLDLYIAGTFNQANSQSKPLRLIFKIVNMLKK